MNKRVKTSAFLASALVVGAFIAGPAMADDHGKMDDMAKGSMEKMGKMHDLAVWGSDQSMADGTVTAKKVNTTQNGWLVVHRTADGRNRGRNLRRAYVEAQIPEPKIFLAHTPIP